MLNKIRYKLNRLLTVASLRVKYQRKPFDFDKFSKNLSIPSINSLDLGSGPNPRNPFNASSVYGVDIRSWDINNNIKKCILGKENIPFKENYFDVVTAFDVLEHIPRISNDLDRVTFPFISAMNEIWRVLKVNGVFYSQTPCFPMREAFQDPTHVNIMTEDTLKLYFADKNWARIYGFVGTFELVSEVWCGSHYCCVLKKTHDKPVLDLNYQQS